jgi:UDP-N-acetyl-D-galactosamine dehydrogenase
MIQNEVRVKNSKILMLGITFKENCPDIRNTKATDIYHELISYGIAVDVYDPWASPEEVKHEYGITIIKQLDESVNYGAVILAVAHNEFMKIDLQAFKSRGAILYDVKGILPRGLVHARL